MACLIRNGSRYGVQWRTEPNGKRSTVHLGRLGRPAARIVCRHVSHLVSAKRAGVMPPLQTVIWLNRIGAGLHEKLAIAGLVETRLPVEGVTKRTARRRMRERIAKLESRVEILQSRLASERRHNRHGTVLPDCLACLSGQLFDVQIPAVGSPCVYFLMLAERIVYIGQSTAIHDRLMQHRLEGKLFDRVLAMNVADNALNATELELIKRFTPPLNVMGCGRPASAELPA